MASVINEDFELLSVADLQGQGSWTGPASKFDVQSSVTQAGSRAVKGTAPGGVNGAFRVFGAYVTAGEQTIYINHNADRVGVDAKMVILNTTSPTTTDYTANGSGCIGLFREAGPDLRASVMTGDNNETGRIDIATGLSFGTWYKFKIEWDNSLGTFGQFRGSYNDGSPTAYIDATVGITFSVLGIGSICLAQNDSATPTTVYYDTLGSTAAANTNFFMFMSPDR